jgi:hypothetical protein
MFWSSVTEPTPHVTSDRGGTCCSGESSALNARLTDRSWRHSITLLGRAAVHLKDVLPFAIIGWIPLLGEDQSVHFCFYVSIPRQVLVLVLQVLLSSVISRLWSLGRIFIYLIRELDGKKSGTIRAMDQVINSCPPLDLVVVCKCL